MRAADFNSVSCPTASDCFALGNYYNGPTTNVAVMDATTDGGTTWTSVNLPVTPSFRLMSLSCPTASDCFAAVDAVVEVSTDGGQSWAAEPLPRLRS
jgi:photosystem II stability/assembly factor-like uncharacterized protein